MAKSQLIENVLIKLMTTNAGYTNSKRKVLNMVDFGIKLAKLRENKRLSQSQLAARLGITKNMVSAYENSARMPSYAVLLRIAGMFNVSLDYLLGTENQIIFRTDGLSESQIAIIMDIIEEFKK